MIIIHPKKIIHPKNETAQCESLPSALVIIFVLRQNRFL